MYTNYNIIPTYRQFLYESTIDTFSNRSSSAQVLFCRSACVRKGVGLRKMVRNMWDSSSPFISWKILNATCLRYVEYVNQVWSITCLGSARCLKTCQRSQQTAGNLWCRPHVTDRPKVTKAVDHPRLIWSKLQLDHWLEDTLWWHWLLVVIYGCVMACYSVWMWWRGSGDAERSIHGANPMSNVLVSVSLYDFKLFLHQQQKDTTKNDTEIGPWDFLQWL